MALTRDFRETIKEQLADDAFRREFLREAVSNMVAGELETVKAVLREYINGRWASLRWGRLHRSRPRA